MKPITRFIIAAFAATSIIPVSVLAQVPDSANQGYLTDSTGAIVMTSSGLCVRDMDWSLARSVEPCDPNSRQVAPAARSSSAIAVPPQQVASRAAPIIIAAAPAAPAAIVPAAPQKSVFSSEALFAFDKSELKPEGKTMLDGLVLQLKDTTYETVFATGHTDRLGSDEYNQKLSERRAQTVKEYLMSSGIVVGRIDAEGKGESHPITKAGECLGPKSAKVIACLAPDRRVDVEMNGTKTIVSSR